LASKVVGLTREQQSVRSTAHAPLCPVVSTGSGGGGGGTTYTVTICSYDAWYDDWGRLIDVISLGCTSYQIGNMT
jgi:hypothetical protein